MVCPQDGRIGASYVDCLEGLDNVGVAIFMLWSYRIIDILSALQSFCEDSKPVIDPKRAYVWICCLCKLFLYSFVCVISLSTSALSFLTNALVGINQHRIKESQASGSGTTSFEDLQNIFGTRVRRIGDTLQMWLHL